MSKYEWLLFLHVTGAFLFLGATVYAWILGVAAARRERPSEIALLLRLTAVAGPLFGLGALLLLVFGIWLVVDLDQYDFWDGWLISALVLLVLSIAVGSVGGKRDQATRMLAQRLAGEGDAPSAELTAHVRDPIALSLNLISSLMAFAVLVLMIWKPGAS